METQTLIIGASAAGLATAACLKKAGCGHEVVEASDVVGSAWRNHYDRLHLHTPKGGSALPGLAMPSDWPRYPARDQVVEYLERYVAHHGISPHYGQRATAVEFIDGAWRVETDKRNWTAKNVVVATGYTRQPVRPSWPGMELYRGEVLHSSEYRNGKAWAGLDVVVAGFGNSACEQALDLMEHGARPHLSVRSAVNVVPRDVLGLIPVLQLGIVMRVLPTWLADALAWPLVKGTIGDLGKVGLRKLPYGPNTQIARDKRVPMLDIGTMAALRSGRITAHPNIARFTEDTVVFEDGSEVKAAAVVLGTGYRPALGDFLTDADVVIDDAGIPKVSGGPTALAGLYFCGFYVSPAGMLREIGIEAQRIATHIAVHGAPPRKQL